MNKEQLIEKIINTVEAGTGFDLITKQRGSRFGFRIVSLMGGTLAVFGHYDMPEISFSDGNLTPEEEAEKIIEFMFNIYDITLDQCDFDEIHTF